MSSPRLIVRLLAAVLLATPAAAQNRATTGEITGLLADATGGVLPGATVTVVNLDDGLTRTAVSDGAGVYHVMLLPPGRYDVRAALAGFGAAALDDVTLTVGASRTINFTLALAGVAEEVTVTAATSAVETTTDTSDVTLDSQAIANLPINGRRFHDFVTLTPTAQVEPQRGQISLAGQRGINGNISIDGADYNQPFFGGIRGGERSQFTFTIPQEAIREFRVVKAGYSPEFGRSTGGLVNAVTKSGANDTSGTAFYLLRPEQLAARNAFGQDAAPTQHQFGGSLGGALARDRAFYFVAYEQQEFRAPREVRFARLDGFTPTAASREGYDHYRAFETPFEVTNDARAWLARVDVNLPRGNRFNVRYNGSTNRALNSDGVGGVITPTTNRSLQTNGTEEDATQTLVGQFTSVPSSDLVFELRGQYSREDRPRSANALAPLVDLSLGEFGTRSFRPTTQYDWRAQAGGNVTWLAGGHSVKGGFDYNHVFIDQTFGFFQNGGYLVFGSDVETTLDIIGAGGAIPNRFGSPSLLYVQQIGNLKASFATDEVGLFVQDEWRVAPNLTVNYGLRWDAQLNPAPDAGNDVLLAQLRGVDFPIGRTVDPTAIPSSGGQLGPRAGFAWDPTGEAKTVVRGFAGIYYARTPMLLMAGPVNNFRVPPGDVTVALPFRVPSGSPHVTLYDQMRLIGIDLNERSLDNLPTLTPDQITGIATALGIDSNPFAGARVTLMDEDFRNPMARQAGAGVQHELRPGWSLGADLLVVDNRPPAAQPGPERAAADRPARRPRAAPVLRPAQRHGAAGAGARQRDGARVDRGGALPRADHQLGGAAPVGAAQRVLRAVEERVQRRQRAVGGRRFLRERVRPHLGVRPERARPPAPAPPERGVHAARRRRPRHRHVRPVGRPVRRADGHRFERGPRRRRPPLQRPRRAVHAQRLPRQADCRHQPARAEAVRAGRDPAGARVAGVFQPLQPRQRHARPVVLHRRQLLRQLARPRVRPGRAADQPRLRPDARRGRRVPDREHPRPAVSDAGRLPPAVLTNAAAGRSPRAPHRV